MTHYKFRKANRTDLLEPETWQLHPDFPLYEVSTMGRVRSLHKRLPHILKPAPGPYFQVVLIRDHLRYDRSVHRLVLETFVGYRPEGMVCRHLNGNSKDNRLTNLKWERRRRTRRTWSRTAPVATVHSTGARSSPTAR